MTDEENILVLTDEEGNSTPLELLEIINYENDDYAVFIPTDDSDESDDEEAADVIILLMKENDDDTVNYTVIDDDALLNKLFELFKEHFKDQYDFV